MSLDPDSAGNETLVSAKKQIAKLDAELNQLRQNYKIHTDQFNIKVNNLRQAHQIQTDQFNSKINNLRKLNHAQNEQSITLRQRVQENSGNDGQRIIQSLIDGLRSTHIEMKPPTFNDSLNPQCFL